MLETVSIAEADTTVCPGVSVTFNANAGLTSYLWNTGETTATITADTAATYIVDGLDANGCLSTDSVVLGNFTVTPIDLGPDSLICAGNDITLDAGSGGVAYVWNSGQTTQMIVTSTAGTYSVVCTDVNGCDAMDTVVITVSTNPVLDLGGDTTVCDNASFSLDAGAGHATYQWGSGNTGQTEPVTASGTYTVTVTDGGNCAQTDSVDVTVSATPGADFSSTSVSDVVTFLDASTGSVTTWAWDFGDGNSSTMQSPSHTYTASGVYTVCLTVTNADGCSDQYCDSVTVIIDGIEDAPYLSSLNIYPNPANEFITIEMHDLPAAPAVFNIYDVEGRIVKTHAMDVTGQLQLNVGTVELEAGTYIVEIYVDGHRTQEQLVIMR